MEVVGPVVCWVVGAGHRFGADARCFVVSGLVSFVIIVVVCLFGVRIVEIVIVGAVAVGARVVIF